MVDRDEEAGGGKAPARPVVRLPYEKPAVSWEERLEVRPGLLAACSKIPNSGEPCESNSSS